MEVTIVHGQFHGYYGRQHVVIVGGRRLGMGSDPSWWYSPYYAYSPTLIVENPPVYSEEQPIAPTTEQLGITAPNGRSLL